MLMTMDPKLLGCVLFGLVLTFAVVDMIFPGLQVRDQRADGRGRRRCPERHGGFCFRLRSLFVNL